MHIYFTDISFSSLDYGYGDGHFSLPDHLVTILNPKSLYSLAVHGWVDLKAQ